MDGSWEGVLVVSEGGIVVASALWRWRKTREGDGLEGGVEEGVVVGSM